MVLLDAVFFAIATLDTTYPSNPELLQLMKFNVFVGSILVLLTIYFFRKFPELFEYLIPVVSIVIKLIYNEVMAFDVNVLLYYMGIFLMLNMILLTRWKMIIIAFLFQGNLIIQLLSGRMDTIHDPYAVVIILTMVIGMSTLWNTSRYYRYVEDANFRDELLNQKKEIESLVALRELTIDLNHKLITHTNLDDYFDYMLSRIVNLTIKANAACVLLDKEGMLHILASNNYKDEDVEQFQIKTDHSFAYQKCAIGANMPIIINDLEELMKEGFPELIACEDGSEIRSTLITPLIMNGEFYGLFNLDSSENYIFNKSDIDMMQYIGEQISIVLENHKLYSKVTELSKYDQLTGFYNRWYLKEIKEKQYPLWRRNKSEVSFVIFDLDNLKHVNDNFGHDVGDQYISHFCKLLENGFRTTDLFIRNGGDEFLGIFFNLESEKLQGMLEDIRVTFRERVYENTEVMIHSSFSYGVVKVFCEEEDIENALKRADEKMYYFKNKHRVSITKNRDVS